MSAWVESKSPTYFAELRSITSALQYYSRFVPHFAAKVDCLFKLQAADSFKWVLQHEQCLRSLLNFRATDAVVRPYSTNTQPTLITDASYLGLGAILEQEGRPVQCVSRRLTKAEQGYPQTLGDESSSEISPQFPVQDIENFPI